MIYDHHYPPNYIQVIQVTEFRKRKKIKATNRVRKELSERKQGKEKEEGRE